MVRPIRQLVHECGQSKRRLSISVYAETQLGDQEQIKKARGKQISSTDLLANLLQAPNLEASAAESVDSMTEDFFMMASTYLDMAKKEGNKDVASKLEIVLQAAMSAKQSTLRPEIQLLNTLLSCKSAEERGQVFRQPETAKRLVMNDRYFFTKLLDRMITDIQGADSQSGTHLASNKQKLLSHQLSLIKEEATACVGSKSQ